MGLAIACSKSQANPSAGGLTFPGRKTVIDTNLVIEKMASMSSNSKNKPASGGIAPENVFFLVISLKKE